MNKSARIKRLEDIRTRGSDLIDIKKYLCIYYLDDIQKGFDAAPLPAHQGGSGGAKYHFETRAQLDAFAARPDIDLKIVCIEYIDIQPD